MKSVKKIKHSVKHSKPVVKAVVAFLILLVLAYFLPIYNLADNIVAVLGSAAIFYSILLGFYISSSMANLIRLKTLTASETGALIAIYKMIEIVAPDKKESTKEKIDLYIVKRFQYEVDNYVEPTTKEFYEIFNEFKGITPKSEGELALLNSVSQSMYYIAQVRREITIAGAKIMNLASWLLLTILSVIIVVSLLFSRDGSITGVLIVSIISTAAVLSLFILYDVDGNMFGEEVYAIDNYQDVFSAMGLLHYYPEHILLGGRYHPPVSEYRTGEPGNLHITKRKA